jgi:Arf-GAP/coiled-coil/ANK repeat/PH domain-containing protein
VTGFNHKLIILLFFLIRLQVRSLTLDVKVWEPSVITLFQSLGNTFANSVWEELLQSRSAFQVDLVPTG